MATVKIPWRVSKAEGKRLTRIAQSGLMKGKAKTIKIK